MIQIPPRSHHHDRHTAANSAAKNHRRRIMSSASTLLSSSSSCAMLPIIILLLVIVLIHCQVQLYHEFPSYTKAYDEEWKKQYETIPATSSNKDSNNNIAYNRMEYMYTKKRFHPNDTESTTLWLSVPPPPSTPTHRHRHNHNITATSDVSTHNENNLPSNETNIGRTVPTAVVLSSSPEDRFNEIQLQRFVRKGNYSYSFAATVDGKSVIAKIVVDPGGILLREREIEILGILNTPPRPFNTVPSMELAIRRMDNPFTNITYLQTDLRLSEEYAVKFIQARHIAIVATGYVEMETDKEPHTWAELKIWLKSLLQLLEFAHSHNIILNDLHHQNVHFDGAKTTLIDWDGCITYEENNTLVYDDGMPHYNKIIPEVVHNELVVHPNVYSCDIFKVGLMLTNFMKNCSDVDFVESNGGGIVITSRGDSPSEDLTHAIGLAEWMLMNDPLQRPSATEALNHPFLKDTHLIAADEVFHTSVDEEDSLMRISSSPSSSLAEATKEFQQIRLLRLVGEGAYYKGFTATYRGKPVIAKIATRPEGMYRAEQEIDVLKILNEPPTIQNIPRMRLGIRRMPNPFRNITYLQERYPHQAVEMYKARYVGVVVMDLLNPNIRHYPYTMKTLRIWTKSLLQVLKFAHSRDIIMNDLYLQNFHFDGKMVSAFDWNHALLYKENRTMLYNDWSPDINKIHPEVTEDGLAVHPNTYSYDIFRVGLQIAFCLKIYFNIGLEYLDGGGVNITATSKEGQRLDKDVRRAVNLARWMLLDDPLKRPSARQALHHPFIRKHGKERNRKS